MLKDLPRLFLQRMQRLLGPAYDAFIAEYEKPPVVGLRVNTLKVLPDRFRALTPFDLQPIPWSPAGFHVLSGEPPGRHAYHAAGLYYLQDPSAMAVAEILNPQPGERVLDLAAAPGGKATHLAALMQNQGLLMANDPHPRRVWELAGNLERWGVRNAVITHESPRRLADRLAGFFDRVLVDAPCSGEGMFRKHQAARVAWTPAMVEGCARRQLEILGEAARMVRPGGWLGYATCTFAPEENEGVVSRFLREHPAYELVAPEAAAFFDPGRPEWVMDAGRQLPLERAVRLWPHRIRGEGHFVALMRRTEDGSAGHVRPWSIGGLCKQDLDCYERFCRKHLTGMPAVHRLERVGSYLYRIPDDLPELKGLRVIHPGWWLGELKRNRFEPSHALAMSLRLQDACRSINLDADGNDVHAYLCGERLHAAGEDGWLIVGVDGFALGWGKRVGEVIKNHYPRGLRWL